MTGTFGYLQRCFFFCFSGDQLTIANILFFESLLTGHRDELKLNRMEKRGNIEGIAGHMQS
jgi:hypothetical protein